MIAIRPLTMLSSLALEILREIQSTTVPVSQTSLEELFLATEHKRFDAALDELMDGQFVRCDEDPEHHAYWVRTDMAAEKAQHHIYVEAVRDAAKIRDAAVKVASDNYAAALRTARLTMDAASPFASIKGNLPS